MKLQVFDIPESHAERIGWLERLIAGPDLGDVASELAALHGATPNGATLETLLGDQLPNVVEQGLKVVPIDRLNQLMRHPMLLLKLQERVLAANRPYWEGLLERNYNLKANADRVTARTLTAIEMLGGEPVASKPSGGAWYANPLVVFLTTAAAVTGIFFGIQAMRPATTPAVATVGWGWAKPGALNESLPAKKYLQSLAEAAGEWDKKRPDDAPGVALRIAQFRQGCSQLILAEHKPLAPADREWLVGKCREWATKLDAHLAAIEAGRPPLEVRAEADVTISKLMHALNERAGKV